MPSPLTPADCAELLVLAPAFRAAVANDDPVAHDVLYGVGCRAEFLQVSEDFLYREIARGRLVARRYVAPSGRPGAYRIEPADFWRYVDTHWPRTVAPVPPAA